ncbi:hypothetical protein [Helcococcus ovis]|uniref:hypothetical protein n=1 Tax=Helcococcus ovis TaxID=72026 RepID=UPI0039B50B9B
MLRLPSLSYLSTRSFLFLFLRGYDLCPFPCNAFNTSPNFTFNCPPILVNNAITTTEINAKIFHAFSIFSPLLFLFLLLRGYYDCGPFVAAPSNCLAILLKIVFNLSPINVNTTITATEINAKIFHAFSIFSPLLFLFLLLRGYYDCGPFVAAPSNCLAILLKIVFNLSPINVNTTITATEINAKIIPSLAYLLPQLFLFLLLRLFALAGLLAFCFS